MDEKRSPSLWWFVDVFVAVIAIWGLFGLTQEDGNVVRDGSSDLRLLPPGGFDGELAKLQGHAGMVLSFLAGWFLLSFLGVKRWVVAVPAEARSPLMLGRFGLAIVVLPVLLATLLAIEVVVIREIRLREPPPRAMFHNKLMRELFTQRWVAVPPAKDERGAVAWIDHRDNLVVVTLPAGSKQVPLGETLAGRFSTRFYIGIVNENQAQGRYVSVERTPDRLVLIRMDGQINTFTLRPGAAADFDHERGADFVEHLRAFVIEEEQEDYDRWRQELSSAVCSIPDKHLCVERASLW
ncbi:MAG: hypothetical protein AB7K24_01910 [Gemmataceae bacterium]